MSSCFSLLFISSLPTPPPSLSCLLLPLSFIFSSFSHLCSQSVSLLLSYSFPSPLPSPALCLSVHLPTLYLSTLLHLLLSLSYIPIFFPLFHSLSSSYLIPHIFFIFLPFLKPYLPSPPSFCLCFSSPPNSSLFPSYLPFSFHPSLCRSSPLSASVAQFFSILPSPSGLGKRKCHQSRKSKK